MSLCATLVVCLLLTAPEGWDVQQHAKLEEAIANADKEIEARRLKNKKPSELSHEEHRIMREEKAAAKERILAKHGKTMVAFEKEKLSLNNNQKQALKQATEDLRKQRENEAVETAVNQALQEDDIRVVTVKTSPASSPSSPKASRRPRR